MAATVRDTEERDFESIIRYFWDAEPAYLEGMGVDPAKLPSADDWYDLLVNDFRQPLEQRQFFYVIWELDGVPAGHSNINKICYAEEAFMHLHLWQPKTRRQGLGQKLLAESISRYFHKFKLQRLLCEPYAFNRAPNKTLPKLGFELVKSYATIPGWINFHQQVNRWQLSREQWLQHSAQEVKGLDRNV